MRTSLIILWSLIVFAAFNYSIYDREQVKKHGVTIYLKLAPVDPRSLMQGDYMRLRYEIENSFPQEVPHIRKVVICADENNEAQFVRVYDKEPLGEGEYLLNTQNRRIMPNTFLFQEGHRKPYEEARYGIFKFTSNGSSLLVGLANKDHQEIKPSETKE